MKLPLPSLILMPVLAVLLAAAFISATSQPLSATELRLAAFSVNISPPLHQRVDVGLIKEFTDIEHPLLAKGIVLQDADGLYVICAVDYCGLCNDSYDMFKQHIAAAAGTTISRVAVQSLHLHTAPIFDANTDRLLYADLPRELRSGRGG